MEAANNLIIQEYLCNECGTNLPGKRFKCMSCTDYDLCFQCLFDVECISKHPDHVFIEISFTQPVQNIATFPDTSEILLLIQDALELFNQDIEKISLYVQRPVLDIHQYLKDLIKFEERYNFINCPSWPNEDNVELVPDLMAKQHLSTEMVPRGYSNHSHCTVTQPNKDILTALIQNKREFCADILTLEVAEQETNSLKQWCERALDRTCFLATKLKKNPILQRKFLSTATNNLESTAPNRKRKSRNQNKLEIQSHRDTVSEVDCFKRILVAQPYENHSLPSIKKTARRTKTNKRKETSLMDPISAEEPNKKQYQDLNRKTLFKIHYSDSLYNYIDSLLDQYVTM